MDSGTGSRRRRRGGHHSVGHASHSVDVHARSSSSSHRMVMMLIVMVVMHRRIVVRRGHAVHVHHVVAHAIVVAAAMVIVVVVAVLPTPSISMIPLVIFVKIRGGATSATLLLRPSPLLLLPIPSRFAIAANIPLLPDIRHLPSDHIIEPPSRRGHASRIQHRLYTQSYRSTLRGGEVVVPSSSGGGGVGISRVSGYRRAERSLHVYLGGYAVGEVLGIVVLGVVVVAFVGLWCFVFVVVMMMIIHDSASLPCVLSQFSIFVPF
mmetsp:Transcript_29267/g.70623  ORF Transcript_29267/g.70623 Transcript_29267/m.70623 type:complete len:264 (-) Transcript_29267:561-1352(-)